MQDYVYILAPFFSWTCTGCLKFAISCIRTKKIDLAHIGYGGMPSNHSAIMGTLLFLVAYKEGITSAAFGVALTFTYLFILDANGLRNHVGKQAQKINSLTKASLEKPLRERIGHKKIEILAGLAVGCLWAWVLLKALAYA